MRRIVKHFDKDANPPIESLRFDLRAGANIASPSLSADDNVWGRDSTPLKVTFEYTDKEKLTFR